jgi:class 3 adenylate cyclase
MLFYYSLGYLPVTLVIIGLSNIRSESGVYFPLIGQVLFFVITISNSVLAHAEEQSSRARFKAVRAMENTKNNVQNILKNMMPAEVLEAIRNSPAGELPSHQYEAATIAQSDLCGFTALASTLKPQQVVEFISDLFGLFDELTIEFGIYKIETIGDAYIAGQAEKPLTDFNSASSVIQFGIKMVETVTKWSRDRHVHVRCRVGVHHGRCLGGIVGENMQRYHIFGALMQGLEILESTAPEGGVQISQACRDAVENEWSESSPGAGSGFQEEREAPYDPASSRYSFKKREGPQLVTSKGEAHSYDEVGGVTSVVVRDGLNDGSGCL